MTAENVPQVAALEKVCFSDPWSEKSVASELENPLSCWMVALDDETVAGYVGSQTVLDETDMMNVAVHPDFRRQGICAKLLAHAEKELKKRYFDCLTLVPATDALRAYYETLGFVSQNAAFFDEGGAPEARGVCEALSPTEYAGLRETVLYDAPHVRYSLADLRYQASMSGFYRLELGSHFGCACAHPDGETLVVDEILPDCSVLPALLKQLPAKRCRVRTVGGSTPFAMCKWLSDARMPDVYLAFDFG